MEKNVLIPPNKECAVNQAGKISVTIRVPESISESVQRQKINRIYDLLRPEESR